MQIANIVFNNILEAAKAADGFSVNTKQTDDLARYFYVTRKRDMQLIMVEAFYDAVEVVHVGSIYTILTSDPNYVAKVIEALQFD